MKKESTTKLKPTTLMARDETLRSVYARNAPDVPDWFTHTEPEDKPILESYRQPEMKNRLYSYSLSLEEWEREVNQESRYIQWLEYYSELMIKHFSK